MPRVFTLPEGLRATISGWGEAANKGPDAPLVIVPEDVAKELERDGRFVIERDGPVAKKKARKGRAD